MLSNSDDITGFTKVSYFIIPVEVQQNTGIHSTIKKNKWLAVAKPSIE
jgi:hypothetical protein